MTLRNPSSRRLLLAILAVALPSLALIGLGARLLVQENRLAQTEWTAQLDQAYIDFAAALDSVGEHVARTGFARNADSSLVLALPIRENRILPAESPTTAPSAPYQAAMDAAQKAEFADRDRQAAIAGYQRAARLASSEADRAWAQLALFRLFIATNRPNEASAQLQAVLHYPPDITDEQGVPVSLYAARTMQADPEVTLTELERHAVRPIQVSTQAAYQYRAVRDSLRSRVDPARLARFSDFVEDGFLSSRLRDDAPSLLPLLSSGRWMLYGGDRWMIGLITNADSSQLLIVADLHEAGERASIAAGLEGIGFTRAQLTSDGNLPNRHLGPRFNGVFGLISPVDDLPTNGWSPQQFLFILLAGLLIVGLASLGVTLLLRDTKRELETARMRSEFVSSVSHELKTPLTAIRMYAETLKIRRQDEDTRTQYIDTIINESARLTRLLNNVLDFSRIEKGTRSYHPEPIALEATIRTSLETMEHVLRENRVQLAFDCPEHDTRVLADADAIEQVMLNLIGNAIKFTGHDKQISVSCQPNGQMATISVSDNGPGIDAEEMPFLFDPYFRSASERTAHIPGTGLGLSIVRHTVEGHGGRVWAESEPGHGTTISFTLPLS